MYHGISLNIILYRRPHITKLAVILARAQLGYLQ